MPPSLNHLVVLAVALAPACGASRSAQERTLIRLFADARGDEAAFAAHFDPAMSRDRVRGLRGAFAHEPPPRFEHGRGPACVRAYWGDYFIDHSYYFYLRAIPGGFVVTDVASDSGGFGEAVGGLFATEHRAPAESEFDRCTAANAAAARR